MKLLLSVLQFGWNIGGEVKTFAFGCYSSLLVLDTRQMTKLIERNTLSRPKSQVFSAAIIKLNRHSCPARRTRNGYRQQDFGKIYSRWYSSAPRGIPQVEVTFDIDANGVNSCKLKTRQQERTENYNH